MKNEKWFWNFGLLKKWHQRNLVFYTDNINNYKKDFVASVMIPLPRMYEM